jgi:AcrR family transcriptional regulator
MRHKLLDATTRMFSNHIGPTPVIDDIIREAQVSRGTFYNYFVSVNEVLAAISQALSDQMTTGILPVYDVLQEPWQRLSGTLKTSIAAWWPWHWRVFAHSRPPHMKERHTA